MAAGSIFIITNEQQTKNGGEKFLRLKTNHQY